jgi:enoyl-CoA hydratase/carnithine racemase
MSKVKFEIDDSVGVITIAAPPLNQVNWQIMKDLDDAMSSAYLPEVRAVLLRAEGKHFSAGADVGGTFSNVSTREFEACLARALSTMQKLQDLPVPTIAAAQGMCFTAGLEIVLRCDLLWASADSKFAHLEAKIGTTTLFGGAQMLVQRAGVARASQIIHSADIFDAETFERWGIVNTIVSNEELQAQALACAKALAKGPTLAHAAGKRLIRTAADFGAVAADRLVMVVAAPVFESTDMQGGVNAFVTHGPSDFVGKYAFQGK